MSTVKVQESPQASPQGSPQLNSASLNSTDQKVNETASLSLKSIWTTTASAILGTLAVLAIGVALGSNPAGWVVSALLIMKGVSLFFFGGSAIAYGTYKAGEMLDGTHDVAAATTTATAGDEVKITWLNNSHHSSDGASTHSTSTSSESSLDLDGVSDDGDDADDEVEVEEKTTTSSWGITSVASGIGSGLAYVWKVTKDFADQLEPDRN